MPNGSFPITVNYTPRLSPLCFVDKTIEPYGFTEVLERNADKDEWGAERFAITLLFADGIATYFQLFVKQFVKAPWLFLLQDHGFGCNYYRFGKMAFSMLSFVNQTFVQTMLSAHPTLTSGMAIVMWKEQKKRMVVCFSMKGPYTKGIKRYGSKQH